MAYGKITKLFPGGNTAKGFYSFYDHIIEDDATRIFILKGGPGTGKSTFMRVIGETLLKRGFDVEFHYCSSDNNSLDGICIPAIRVAVVDGTAPHVVDPKNPGAVDEIIHLGDFWDKDKLLAVKQQIRQSNVRIGRFFRIAYHQLAEAKVIKDELDSYLEEAANQPRLHELSWKIINRVMEGAPIQFERKPKARHLFATAFTPGGQWHYLDTILQDVGKLFLLTGDASGLASDIVRNVAEAARKKGVDTSVFHCPLAPDNIDLVILPQQACAVMKEIPGIDFKAQNVPSITQVESYNLNRYLNESILTVYAQEIENARTRLTAAINRAIKYITKAKAEHDHMENYYIPAMDFAAVNAKRDEILARVLKYAAAPFNTPDTSIAKEINP